MRLKKYEIRMYVTKTLHDHISQIAKIRNAKMSQVAREKLSACFLPKNEDTHSFESSNKKQANHTFNSSLIKIEKKLSSAISKIESLRSLTHDHSKLLITMVDQLYFDLMLYFPQIPDEFADVAIATAKLRHSQWFDKLKEILHFEIGKFT